MASDTHGVGRSSRRLRSAFLAAQIALTTALLVAAGLLTRAIGHALTLDPGFAIADLQEFSVTLPAKTRPDVSRSLHGAIAAAGLPPLAWSSVPPISTVGMSIAVRHPGDAREMNRRFSRRPVSAGYFRTLGIPVLSGRTFDDVSGGRELVVSAAAARQLWPNANAIGQRLVSNDMDRADDVKDVVGVVADVSTRTITTTEPVIYSLADDDAPIWLMRNNPSLDPGRVTSLIHSVVSGAVVSSHPLTGDVRESLDDLVTGSRAAWLLGLLALSLAVIGAFATFAALVEERRREIGIRIALGARASHVVRFVVAGARGPLLGGLAAGFVLSMVGAPVLRGFLYGLSPFDPLAYAEIAGILTAAAAFATWIPARRAARVEPAITLRGD